MLLGLWASAAGIQPVPRNWRRLNIYSIRALLAPSEQKLHTTWIFKGMNMGAVDCVS